MTALGNTIVIALISAAVSTLLGTIGAIGTFIVKKEQDKQLKLLLKFQLLMLKLLWRYL